MLFAVDGHRTADRCAAADESAKLMLVDVQRIWDRAPHNAFTDLIRFKDRWFCVFREGKSHVSSDGALRVITSADGKRWESAARITSETSDLRDAKITVTPDGRLMLAGAEALKLPSRGDTGYAGLVWHDGLLWTSYYSSHEGRTSIYLARVRFED